MTLVLAPTPDATWLNADHTAFDVNVMYKGAAVRTTIAQNDAEFTDGALIAHSAIAAYVAPLPTVEQLANYTKDMAYARLKTARSYTASGVTILIDATQGSRTDLGNLAQWGTANPTALQPWVDNAGAVTPVTGAQYVALTPLVGAYTLSVYAVLAGALAALRASPPTITTTAQIDALAWPT